MRLTMRPAEALLFHDRGRAAEELRGQADELMRRAVAAICASHGAEMPAGAPRLEVDESTGAAALVWQADDSGEA